MATSVSLPGIVVLDFIRRGNQVCGLGSRPVGGLSGLLAEGGAVGGAQRPVDVDERVLLTFGQLGVRTDRELDGSDLDVVRAEDRGPDVERLVREPQFPSDRMQRLAGGSAKSAVD